MKTKLIRNLTISAMLLAIGLVLPFLTGQIQQIGTMLLPMHIPVFLCGLICGWKYGGAVGFILPLMRSAMFTMPPMYPHAVAMAFELLTYGLVAGLLYEYSKRQNLITLYRSMIIAMLAGRLVWGAAQIILLGSGENGFTTSMFMTGAFTGAVPGIILQFALIPAVMSSLNKTGLLRYRERSGNTR